MNNMENFLNVIAFLVLVRLAIASISYIQYNQSTFTWDVLYLLWITLVFIWSVEIKEEV
jgi:hypothetical protein